MNGVLIGLGLTMINAAIGFLVIPAHPTPSARPRETGHVVSTSTIVMVTGLALCVTTVSGMPIRTRKMRTAMGLEMRVITAVTLQILTRQIQTVIVQRHPIVLIHCAVMPVSKGFFYNNILKDMPN